MNLKEFAALKSGDKIENPSTALGNNTGEIVEATDSGVRVVWGARHDRETRFFYSVVGTAWMNWVKIKMCPSGVRCTSDRCEKTDQCLAGDYDAVARGLS